MSVIKAGTTLTTAYTVEADTTGALEFKTGPSATLAMSISSSGVVTFPATTGFDIASANITNLTSGTTSATVLRSASGTITNLLATTATVSASAFFATASGSVGVGTSSPGGKLNIVQAKSGTAAESYDMLRLNLTGTAAIGDSSDIVWYNGSTKVASIKGILGEDNALYGTFTFSTRSYNTDTLVEAVRINNRSNVGIGTTIPTHRLDVRQESASTTVMVGIRVNNDSYTSNTQSGIALYAADNYNAKVYTIRTGSSSGNLVFGTNGGGGIAESNVVERARFNSTGAFVFAGGTTTADGIGITFPATQSASSNANTLDDYEEGTWSPVLRGSNTAGTYELQAQEGVYTKIGNQVTASAYMQLSSSITGGGVGYAQITGLPFTKIANMNFTGSIRLNNVDFTGSFVIVQFTSNSATNLLYFAEIVDNGASIDLPISAFSASDICEFTLTYFV